MASSAAVAAPARELLEWLALRPRTDAETMSAWRTHYPRLAVWEDALAAGLVEIRRGGSGELAVVLADGPSNTPRSASACKNSTAGSERRDDGYERGD